jgi:hypothetical protein
MHHDRITCQEVNGERSSFGLGLRRRCPRRANPGPSDAWSNSHVTTRVSVVEWLRSPLCKRRAGLTRGPLPCSGQLQAQGGRGSPSWSRCHAQTARGIVCGGVHPLADRARPPVSAGGESAAPRLLRVSARTLVRRPFEPRASMHDALNRLPVPSGMFPGNPLGAGSRINHPVDRP